MAPMAPRTLNAQPQTLEMQTLLPFATRLTLLSETEVESGDVSKQNWNLGSPSLLLSSPELSDTTICAT